MTLNFRKLADAVERRAPEWGDDPGLEFRFIELGGETGECLEAGKKYLRHVKGMVGGCSDLKPIEEEIGDVIISAIALANTLGIEDVGKVVRDKFNQTSEKRGFKTKL